MTDLKKTADKLDDKNYIVISLITPNKKLHTGCKVIGEHDIYPMIYYKVYGPSSFMDCFEWIGFNCSKIDPWWEVEEKLAKERSLAGRKHFKAVYETRKVEVGHIDGVPETKVEWEGDIVQYPVLYTRTSKITAYAEFSAPNIGDIWGDITSCAVAAAAVAGIAAIIASPAAALPVFKEAFMQCITAKIGERANQISVVLSTEQTSGQWHRV
jgi:hypothetical protein